jgi:hypothetical protein
MHRNPRRPLRAISRFLAPSLLLLILFGCGRATPTVETPPATPWNVVILMIDTLRADRLDLYGYARPTTPHLKALARSGVVLRDARSQAGCTYPSVSSFMTSRWPQHFINRQDTYGMAIPEGHARAGGDPSRPRLLDGGGVEQRRRPQDADQGESSGRIRARLPDLRRELSGTRRGLRERARRGAPRPALAAVPALSALPRSAPALSTAADASTATLGGDGGERPRLGAARRPATRDPAALRAAGALSGRSRDAATLSALYDEEIAYLDERLGELMQRLEDSALLERTIVVLLADHGEELLDHGEWGHCRNLAFETVLHTPLVLWIPMDRAASSGPARRATSTSSRRCSTS